MSIQNLNYYETLGINQSATADEIRRAYRILARRYHPDLNPGRPSEERFKQIALAYQTLTDPDKRRAHDSELDSAKKIRAGFAAYEKAQKFSYSRTSGRKNHPGPQYNSSSHSTGRQNPGWQQHRPENVTSYSGSTLNSIFHKGLDKLASVLDRKPNKPIKSREKESATKKTTQTAVKTRNISVVEMSISTPEAISGVRKSIEVQAVDKVKKVSVHIPCGVRTGSVLRLNAADNEDYIIILKVAPHPLLELSAKGLIVNLAVNISEALFGASIKVPGLDNLESINIPAGSQSGDEIRLTNKGIKFESGQRGDLFYKLLIQIPSSNQAVGLQDKVKSLSEYYESPLRTNLPAKLTDL